MLSKLHDWFYFCHFPFTYFEYVGVFQVFPNHVLMYFSDCFAHFTLMSSILQSFAGKRMSYVMSFLDDVGSCCFSYGICEMEPVQSVQLGAANGSEWHHAVPQSRK